MLKKNLLVPYFVKITSTGMAIFIVIVGCILLGVSGSARANLLFWKNFNDYHLDSLYSVSPPPSPGDFPRLNGVIGWQTQWHSQIILFRGG